MNLRHLLLTLVPALCGGVPAIVAGVELPRLARSPESCWQREDLTRTANGNPLTLGRRDGVAYLDLPAGAEWSRPLRAGGKGALHVVLVAQVSAGTIVEAGGARLGFIPSPAERALQVMSDDPVAGWRPLGLHLGTAPHAGRSLAAAPVLTLRLDPARRRWDLFAGPRLVAADLPAGPGAAAWIRVRAGGEGAWLQEVLQSDDHPWCEDADRDGVDDAFAAKRRTGSAASPRGDLVAAWREEQRRRPPPPARVVRPR
ncbi:MAG: hypothetical protein FJ381_13765, partial [Verrucomicrobia bacterium]|nr:hypothetical protein [Verrucomicrobiota bacterium]